MNREDVIRMAREAGLLLIGTADGGEAVYTWPQGITDEIERFAQAAYAAGAAAEREACAKVCENYTDNHGGKYADFEGHGYECAEAIRARGNT